MQISKTSKTFLMVCAALCCAGSISFAASESLSQAQAREALRKKIAELNAQEAAAAAQAQKTPSAGKKTEKSTSTLQPVVQQPPATVGMTLPSTAPTSRVSNEQMERLREAMRQKIAELDAPPQAVVTAPVVKPPDVFVVEKEAVATTEVKAHEEDQKHAVAEARARKTKNAKAKPGVETEVKPTIFTPLETPPPAVPASKEAKLADLLGKYKTDQITPEEYHKERARILAEP